jgi:hypothetical protein
MKTLAILLATLPLSTSLPTPTVTHAPFYEQCTHQVLTNRAVTKSNRLNAFLLDAGLDGALFDGISNAPNGLPGGRQYIDWANQAGVDSRVLLTGFSAGELIEAGAVLEDGTIHEIGKSQFTSMRSLNHFYDPQSTVTGGTYDSGLISAELASLIQSLADR